METRVALVEMGQTNHEKVCADRYRDIQFWLRWIICGIVAVLLVVAGSETVQLYSNAARSPAATHVREFP